MSELTKGHSLPDVDVVFESYKFNSLHEYIMDAATRWAKNETYGYGQEKLYEASVYLDALMIVLVGTIPANVRSDIYDEYHAMLFGNRPGMEVSNEKTLES